MAGPGIALYVLAIGSAFFALGGVIIALTPQLRQLQRDAGLSLGQPVKRCPDCAESVLAEARVCKHCGYRFDTTPMETTTPKPGDAMKEPDPKPRPGDDGANPPGEPEQKPQTLMEAIAASPNITLAPPSEGKSGAEVVFIPNLGKRKKGS